MADLQENFAVDSEKMVVTGCSNGGMMTQYIVSQLPHMFRAAVPNYALPLTVRGDHGEALVVCPCVDCVFHGWQRGGSCGRFDTPEMR